MGLDRVTRGSEGGQPYGLSPCYELGADPSDGVAAPRELCRGRGRIAQYSYWSWRRVGKVGSAFGPLFGDGDTDEQGSALRVCTFGPEGHALVVDAE